MDSADQQDQEGQVSSRLPLDRSRSESPRAPSSRPWWRRALLLFEPSHRHSIFSATLVLMISALASRVIGLVRVKYIAYVFGAGRQTDAYLAAFQLPNMISYFLVGGTASIAFISILSRYKEAGDEAEGERAMCVILTVMLCVLGTAILIAEFLAPLYVSIFMPKFSPEQAALCVHMTRIMLPAQLFFFAGGVFSAVLLVRKQFTYQAFSPLIYNVGIILGGVILARSMGVSSLAVGVFAGALLGPLALNAIGAHRADMHFRFRLDWRHPGLREWVRMSLPLMLGVTIVTADEWIIIFFASGAHGQITRLTYAKNLFTAPMAILGQAAGAASLPFFASLFSQHRLQQFAGAVNASVSRILAFSFLASAWMVGLAYPAVDLIFRGGSFHSFDARETAHYFMIFSVSLFLWTAQAIYSRAFYAAGNTIVPMVAGVVVTALSLPIYWSLHRSAGPVGLAVASDLAILLQTVTLAVLLHRRRMVRISGLEARELGRVLVATCASTAAIFAVRQLLPVAGRFGTDLILLAVGSVVWLAAAGAALKLTGSALPAQLYSRLRG